MDPDPRKKGFSTRKIFKIYFKNANVLCFCVYITFKLNHHFYINIHLIRLKNKLFFLF